MKKLMKEIESRRSYRAMSEQSIDQELITLLFQAASLAPSCMNKQPWEFIAVTEAETLSHVHDALSEGNYWAKKAPLLVLVIADPKKDCQLPDGREYAEFDIGMACMNLMLQAEACGLYAHPMAGFSAKKLKKLFHLDNGKNVLTVIAVAYPGAVSSLSDKHQEEESSLRKRTPLTEHLFYNEYGKS